MRAVLERGQLAEVTAISSGGEAGVRAGKHSCSLTLVLLQVPPTGQIQREGNWSRAPLLRKIAGLGQSSLHPGTLEPGVNAPQNEMALPHHRREILGQFPLS